MIAKSCAPTAGEGRPGSEPETLLQRAGRVVPDEAKLLRSRRTNSKEDADRSAWAARNRAEARGRQVDLSRRARGRRTVARARVGRR